MPYWELEQRPVSELSEILELMADEARAEESHAARLRAEQRRRLP